MSEVAPERFAINQATGAIDNATKQATDEVLRTLKDIKADAEDAVADMPPAVRNIMALVEGIEEGKWDKILEGGGPIIAKAVITTIINVIVTPAFAPIVGPVVDVMVQERVDLAINILKASKKIPTRSKLASSSSSSTCKRWSAARARSSRTEPSKTRRAVIWRKPLPVWSALSATSWMRS